MARTHVFVGASLDGSSAGKAVTKARRTSRSKLLREDRRGADGASLSIIPIVLAAGIPLFAGFSRRHPLKFLEQRVLGGAAVQLRYEVRAGG
jgi:hypothetical protein